MAADADAQNELLELRLRNEALERDLEITQWALTRQVAALEALPHRQLWRVVRKVDHVRHLAHPAATVAAGWTGVDAGVMRVPLAGFPTVGDATVPPQWRDATTVDGITLPGLLADPPHTLRWRVNGEAAHLRAFAALRPAAWLRNRGGVRFRIALSSDDGTVLAEAVREVDPAARAADRSWLPMTLALLRTDRPRTLELSTTLPDGADGAFSWAVWGDPVLLAGVGVEPLPRRREAARGVAEAVRADVARGAAGALRARRARRADPRPPTAGTVSLLMPVHDPDPGALEEALASVMAQGSDGWQLCIADDGSTDPRVRALLDAAARDDRVELVRNETAGGISAATNLAFSAARGEWVATLDHDDLLAPGAIAAVRRVLAERPATDVLYSDNDKVAGHGIRFAPSLKPGWSPDLLRACMYTLHLGVYRRALVEAAGGWRSAFDGAQDHDLLLRLSELTDRIEHLPETLYGWRVHAGSAALGELAKPEAYDRGAAAVGEHLGRLGLSATAVRLPEAGRYRVLHEPPAPGSVAVVLPLLDAGPDLAGPDLPARARAALIALADRTAPGHQLIVVSGPGTREAARGLPDRVRVVDGEAEDWARLAAAGVAATEAATVVLLEELCAPDAPDWERELAAPLVEAAVAASGTLLLDEHGTVLQHGLAVRGGLPLPVHPGVVLDPDTELPPALTMVGNRSAAGGAVAVRRDGLRQRLAALPPGRLALATLTARMSADGGRVRVSPHAPWRVVGPARTAVVALEELRAFRDAWGAREDPFMSSRLWADRAADVVPRALQPAGRLGEGNGI